MLKGKNVNIIRDKKNSQSELISTAFKKVGMTLKLTPNGGSVIYNP